MQTSLVSLTCLLRALPLFFCEAPQTPLRVLCIVALDTLHVLRHSKALPKQRMHELATFLDFQASTNAVWDQKHLCNAEYETMRQRMERAGLCLCIEEYLERLGDLERRRPSIGGDHMRFDEVRLYREAVARLSLATVAAIALNTGRVEEDVRVRQQDSDVESLFPIVMQCQIIDDVLDYTEDRAAALPSFLTSCASLSQAMALTARAARSYGASLNRPSSDGVFPLRIALCVVTAVTKLVVRVADRRYTRGKSPISEHHPEARNRRGRDVELRVRGDEVPGLDDRARLRRGTAGVNAQ